MQRSIEWLAPYCPRAGRRVWQRPIYASLPALLVVQHLSPWPWPLIMAIGTLLVWWIFDRPPVEG